MLAAASKCGLMVDSERKRDLQREFNRGKRVKERKGESRKGKH